MAKLRDDNFYQIYGWMISKLGLKGTQLSIFAIIYNVSQDGETEYAGSITYLQEFCGGVSKSTILRALKALTNAGFLLRREEELFGCVFVRYKANMDLIESLSEEGVSKSNGGCQNDTGVYQNDTGGVKMTPGCLHKKCKRNEYEISKDTENYQKNEKPSFSESKKEEFSEKRKKKVTKKERKEILIYTPLPPKGGTYIPPIIPPQGGQSEIFDESRQGGAAERVTTMALEYLNNKTGTRFTPQNRYTQRYVRMRMKEGYTLKDLKFVIDKKVDEWLSTNMQAYLRPETLFGNKFEGYLNGLPALFKNGKDRTKPHKNAKKEAEFQSFDIEDFYKAACESGKRKLEKGGAAP